MLRRRRSTRLRLTVMLTLALLPLGVISVYQSSTLVTQARQMSERALLGETLRAAAAQREVLQTAIGRAEALAPLLRTLGANPQACGSLLAQVVETAPEIRTAAFVHADGQMDCTSGVADFHDFANSRAFARLSERQTPYLDTGVTPGTDDGEVLLVSEPVRDDAGEVTGFAVLSVPRAALSGREPIPGLPQEPVTLVTFNDAGRIVLASASDEPTADLLPADRGLERFDGTPAHAFTTRSADGRERAYAVVPVIEGALYVLGTWGRETGVGGARSPLVSLGLVLPLLMWGASLLVAYFAVRGLVLDPLGQLRARMQAFASGSRDMAPLELKGAPVELAQVAESFQTMTARIVADEARLAKSVRDQELLLKEVHHRVKNNLQLIASILNMQLRQQRAPEARAILHRVQDRVMGLATVHQHLYQSTELSALRADELVRAIANRMLGKAEGAGIAVDMRLDPVTLYPDQAVPLALLVGEAMTNVLSYIGRAEDGSVWCRLRLTDEGDGDVSLEIANSVGTPLAQPDATHRAGLGAQLIHAFAEQLDGALSRSSDAEGHRLNLRFQATGFTGAEARA